MSSTESSGAPAEAAATPPADAPSAPVSTFGTSRGSGLARGKRSGSPAAAAAAPAATGYKPTAIEIVNAPREYQNPFAPATPEPAPQVAETTPASETAAPTAAPAPAPAQAAPELFPLDEKSAAPAAASTPEEKTELNILPPERPRAVAHQTWESDNARPTREPRGDRPRREGRPEGRPEGERRERREGGEQRPEGQGRETPRHERSEFRREDRAQRAEAATTAAAQPTGLFAKIKAFFTGGSAQPEAKPGQPSPGGGEQRGEGRGHRHHRGGRGGHRHHRHGDRPQAQGGEQAPGGEAQTGEHRHEHRGEGRGGEGGHRRRRGGRGRGRGGDRGGDRGGYRGERGGDSQA